MSATDTLWVLLGIVLVFFMQAGFAILESGLTRAKNAGNIIMKNIMDFVFRITALLDNWIWDHVWSFYSRHCRDSGFLCYG